MSVRDFHREWSRARRDADLRKLWKAATGGDDVEVYTHNVIVLDRDERGRILTRVEERLGMRDKS